MGSVSDPSVAYPPDTTGFTTLDESFGGIIHATPPNASTPELSMYCIDIRTPTNIGYGYNLGTWDEANVPNAGYVARILNEYYPTVADEPAIGSPGVADANAQAAAVQAAIWYFSDNSVVSSSDPKFPAVQAIVEAVRTQDPLPQPTAPTITIEPATATGETTDLVGPLTVDANLTPLAITLTAVGAGHADLGGS